MKPQPLSYRQKRGAYIFGLRKSGLSITQIMAILWPNDSHPYKDAATARRHIAKAIKRHITWLHGKGQRDAKSKLKWKFKLINAIKAIK